MLVRCYTSHKIESDAGNLFWHGPWLMDVFVWHMEELLYVLAYKLT